MSDQMGFVLNLEEHGRHECAAQILACLLYPEWKTPDQTLHRKYESLCAYLLKFTANHSNDWAENRQPMRPIHVFVGEKRIAQARRDIQTRLPKALWAGLVALELVTEVRSMGQPGDPVRTSVDPIAEDMAGHLKMSATNFKARVWRPWARSAHLCATYAHFHLYDYQRGHGFNLIEFLILSDNCPFAFAAMAASLEERVGAHPKIPGTPEELVRVRISENGS